MPLLPGQSKQAWAFGRAALLAGLAWRGRCWQPGSRLCREACLRPGASPGRSPLVLSSPELQSRENDFRVKPFVGEGRARSACPIPPQTWRGQPAGCLPAPHAPPWAGQEGSEKTDLLCAHQAWGREAEFVCVPRRATLLFRISLSRLPGFLTPHPVQAGHFTSFQGATLCACWEMLLSHLLRRPFSPVV